MWISLLGSNGITVISYGKPLKIAEKYVVDTIFVSVVHFPLLSSTVLSLTKEAGTDAL